MLTEALGIANRVLLRKKYGMDSDHFSVTSLLSPAALAPSTPGIDFECDAAVFRCFFYEILEAAEEQLNESSIARLVRCSLIQKLVDTNALMSSNATVDVEGVLPRGNTPL